MERQCPGPDDGVSLHLDLRLLKSAHQSVDQESGQQNTVIHAYEIQQRHCYVRQPACMYDSQNALASKLYRIEKFGYRQHKVTHQQ